MSGSPMGNIEMHPGIEVEMNFFTDSGDSASGEWFDDNKIFKSY